MWYLENKNTFLKKQLVPFILPTLWQKLQFSGAKRNWLPLLFPLIVHSPSSLFILILTLNFAMGHFRYDLILRKKQGPYMFDRKVNPHDRFGDILQVVSCPRSQAEEGGGRCVTCSMNIHYSWQPLLPSLWIIFHHTPQQPQRLGYSIEISTQTEK